MSGEEPDQLRQIASEHHADLQSRFREERSLFDAQRTGIQTAMLTMVGLAGLTMLLSWKSEIIVGTVVCLMLVTIPFGLLTGIIAGWLAHRVFWGTMIPVRRMAIALSLIAVFTLYGWILVLIWPSFRM